ncbi:MAG TPA: hypothetical protein VFE58_08205 [Tepidisphaeraceae bacterium]|jgi:hypothetical protein|nr:hypothetical protein [Tepidisphaeraceae bacterium]
MSFAAKLLAVLALPTLAFAADAPPASWQPDVFPVTYWCGPPAKFTTLERYKEIKDANFSYAFPIFGPATVEDNLKQLDYCQQVGLKAFIYDSRMSTSLSEPVKKGIDGMIKDYADKPALAGYFIADEPGPGGFPGLATVVKYLHEKDPAHPGFINLLPTYARGAGVFGKLTYEQYVQTYTDIVHPFAISYDHYHFTNGGDGPEFFENLDTVRKISLSSHTPFWNIILVTRHGDYRNLTQAEMSYEAMQTLAYGGKGLVWFTYWSPTGYDSTTVWSHSIINPDGSHDPHYDMVKAVNGNVLSFGSQLLTATSASVYQFGPLPSHGTLPPADAPIATKDAVQLSVGIFKSADNHTLGFIANRDYKTPAHFTLSTHPSTIEAFDRTTRKWSQADPAAALDIPPGDAILFRW